MSKQLFANNATALLAASISDSDLTIQVASGFGVLYPNPGAGEHFYVTLVSAAGDREIVKITSRSTDLLTVPSGGRGQDGSSAQSWTGGQTRVDARLNRVTMEQFIQREGDTMEGDLDMDDNDLQNAIIVDPLITGGQSVGTPMRGVADDSSNELLVPDDGTRATAGGARLLTEDDNLTEQVFAAGMVMQWYGVAADVPAGWAICNGSGGTPDMRGLFVRGASVDGDIAAAAGGAATSTPIIAPAGAHDHGAVTGTTVLDETQIPDHSHRLYVWESGSSGAGQMENFANSGLGPAQGVAGNADSNTYAYRANTHAGTPLIEPSSGGGSAGHNHAIAGASDHEHTSSAVDIIPPYKYLYYIMKT